MATVYAGTGGSFSPTNFRNSFKDGIGRPALFVFKIKRYPNVYYTKTNSTGLGGVISNMASTIGLNSSIVDKALTIGGSLYETVKGRGLSDLQFRVGKVSLPSKNLETYTTKTYGPATEFPREIENSSMNLSVLCSGSYYEHEFFQTWIDSVVGYKNKKETSTLDLVNSLLTTIGVTKETTSSTYGFDLEYYDDIISEAELVIYNEMGKPSYIVTFEDVYPKVVGGIEFDWNAKNEVSEFSVVLNYRTMKVERIAVNLGGNIVNEGLAVLNSFLKR